MFELQPVEIFIFVEFRCRQGVDSIRGEGYLEDTIQYTPRMLCGIGGQAGSTDACRGDSGGAFAREVPVSDNNANLAISK